MDSKLSRSRNGSRLSSSGVPIDRTRWTPAPSMTGRGTTTRATGRETGLDTEDLLWLYIYAGSREEGAKRAGHDRAGGASASPTARPGPARERLLRRRGGRRGPGL